MPETRWRVPPQYAVRRLRDGTVAFFDRYAGHTHFTRLSLQEDALSLLGEGLLESRLLAVVTHSEQRAQWADDIKQLERLGVLRRCVDHAVD